MHSFPVFNIRVFLSVLAVVLSGCDGDVVYSDIKPDEFVEFFRTAAWQDETSGEWHVPIHGWIYEPENSSVRIALFSAVLKSEYDLEPDGQTSSNYTRRLNLMIADNERGKKIHLNFAGRSYALPPSNSNGHFQTTLILSAAGADEFAKDGIIHYSVVTAGSDRRTFSGESRLVRPAGLALISDIDDTVKISNVTQHRSLIEHTFFLDFVAAPGMARLYTDWSKRDLSFHFVSSSPWQLYSPLQEFLDDHDFPWATLDLKSVRFRDETLFNLFKEGTETKPAVIESILRTYGERKFILVGDSGEKDPEVYAALLRKYPQQILKVFIRNVTQESALDERFVSVFDGIDAECWQLFDDPESLAFPQ